MPSSLERDAARLFCVGFSGVQPPPEFVELVRRGVRCSILFSRNLGEPAEVSELSRTLKALVGEPLGLFVDQEGGKVQRLRNGFTPIPALRALGQRSERETSGHGLAVSARELAFRLGSLIGSELRAVGIDVALAPVLDVDTNPANPVIGERSFSRDPEIVAQLGVALSRGLIQAGVGACAKHFPGHGDTALDSHLALPRLEHSLERMNAVELVPFRAAIAAGIPAIMTAHVVFSALDPELPATLSPTVLRLLREKLGFGGLLVSDDSEMRALVDHFGLDEAVVLGIGAGLDLFLVCHTPSRAAQGIDALVRAVEDGRLPRERLTDAARRVEAFLGRFAGPPASDLSRLRCPEHLALVEELASPTVQR
jgi:beta-N-acetylhexosaminidase